MVLEQRARITSKGQLTIPKEVRRALGLKEGDSVVFELEDGSARVRVVRRPVSFADYAGIWREGGGITTENINAYVQELRGHED